MRERYGGKLFSWVLVLLLAMLAVYPALAYPVAEHAEDTACFHVYRAVVFTAARADGALYPRWVQSINAGLGGPLFSFYSPLTFYLLDGLHAVGIPPAPGWGVLVGLSMLLGAAGMFALALSLFRRADVALASAACFTYAPHLIVDFYERGSPQALPIILSPWLLWALLRLARRPNGLRLAMAALAWALMVLAHAAAALWALPVAGLFLVYLRWRERASWRALGACLLALAAGSVISAFFVLPYAAERGFVQADNNHRDLFTQPVKNPVSWETLLAPPPILDTGAGNNELGRSLGWLHASLLVLGLGLGIVLWRRRRWTDMILPVGMAALGVASVWLQTEGATPIWAAIPMLSILEFRWRLQSTLGLEAALILGCLLMAWPFSAKVEGTGKGTADKRRSTPTASKVQALGSPAASVGNRVRTIVAVALAVTFVGLELPSLYPQLLPRLADFTHSPTPAEAEAYGLSNKVPGLSAFSEEQPVWRTAPFTEEEAQQAAATPLSNLPAGGRLSAVERRTGRWQMQIESPVAFKAAFYLLYFPGWAGYVDGARQTLTPLAGLGYAQMDIPAGMHTIVLRYEGTPVQHIADGLSILAVLAVVAAALLWRGPQAAAQPAQAAGAVSPGQAPSKGLEPADLAGPIYYFQPRWWVAAGLGLLIAAKLLWVDPHTTWLRWASTPAAPHGAQVQSNIWFGDSIRLCGYRIESTRLHPSERVRVTLYWGVSRRITRPAYSFVHLLGPVDNPEEGNPVWGQQDKQVPAGSQLIDWQPGQLYPDSYEFPVSPKAPQGNYQLEIGWQDAATGQRLPVSVGQPGAPPGSVNFDVSGLRVSPSLLDRAQQLAWRLLLPHTLPHPRQETLGTTVRLLGYDVQPAQAKPGQTVHLTLYWQDLAPMQTSYKVFTHLLDGQGQSYGGHDGIPVHGTRPTTVWTPGEILADRHDITLPATIAPGAYRFEIGLYEESSGARLPAYGAQGQRLEQDRIMLDGLAVK